MSDDVEAVVGDDAPLPERPLVREVHPELVAELVRLLEEEGERDLSVVVRDVRLYGACGCSDDFCQSLRTSDHRPGTPYGEGHRCLPLPAETGMLVLDVVHGRISSIEVIDRPAMIRRDL
ncbi:hypothetical protein [Streptomyces globisporus]|uniref:hypothetical protein n=1 Tax=Streptomyces globisporus TaxID=1908 RepID=UPI0006919937|nr:hypothetical protein [Streptomyces globisporus]